MSDTLCFKCGRAVIVKSNSTRCDERRGYAHAICPRRKRPRGKALKKRLPTRHRKRDNELTEARHFKDERSFVTTQDVEGKSHEILYGEDMSVRRAEVLTLYHGLCFKCGAYAIDNGQVHHLKHRGRGGSDDMVNLAWICVPCHRREHVSVQWSKKS